MGVGETKNKDKLSPAELELGLSLSIIRFFSHLPINGLSSKLSLRLDQMVLADLDTFCKRDRQMI